MIKVNIPENRKLDSNNQVMFDLKLVPKTISEVGQASNAFEMLVRIVGKDTTEAALLSAAKSVSRMLLATVDSTADDVRYMSNTAVAELSEAYKYMMDFAGALSKAEEDGADRSTKEGLKSAAASSAVKVIIYALMKATARELHNKKPEQVYDYRYESGLAKEISRLMEKAISQIEND